MATLPDPRTEIEPTVRPVIETPRRIIPLWAIIAGGILLGLFLFLELNARRVARNAPAANAPVATQLAAGPDLPQLYLPPVALTPEPVRLAPSPPLPVTAAPRPVQPLQPPAPPMAQPVQPPGPVFTQTPPPPQRQRAAASGDQVLVFDGTVGDSAMAATSPNQPAASGGGQAVAASGSSAPVVLAARARPGNLLNSSTIVPQGTLIPAVLETALDSTRPGGVRALVTRDVVGFDGARVLIPRGSRLYGEYRADLAPGQNRALVIWTRLVRPDGVSVALDSPAADPLGRNGIRGKVDSHFIERFGSALLQTALDIGSNVAVRELSGNSTTILALPGSLIGSNGSSSGGSLSGSGNFQRTLKVRQGTSVSVFVSRDLDFTAVDAR